MSGKLKVESGKIIKAKNKEGRMSGGMEVWQLSEGNKAGVCKGYTSPYLYTSKKAFTLAEVLITLGVIGVVFAITMPTLIQNYQKSQTINRLKSAYSLLNNAIEMAKIDNGLNVNEWYMPDAEQAIVSDYFAEHYLIPYLKVIKDDCKAVDRCSISYKQLNGKNVTRNGERVFTLANGTVVSVEAFNSTNLQNDGKFRALLTIFINGLKKNNVMGHDIFRIELGGTSADKNKFLPYYYRPNAEGVYDCSKDSDCEGCFGLIMKQGWKITDDYPW